MKVCLPKTPILPIKLVALATSLERSQNGLAIIKRFYSSASPENLVKIHPVLPGISLLTGRPLKK